MGQPISIQRGRHAGEVLAREEKVSLETRKACLFPFTSCDGSFVLETQGQLGIPVGWYCQVGDLASQGRTKGPDQPAAWLDTD